MDKIKKILVPTDFSVCSSDALSYGVFLARQLKATLLLVYIIDPMAYPRSLARLRPFGCTELKMGQDLDRLARPWRMSGVPIETHILTGVPAVGIVEAARGLACDLIIMGTHGRTGISHALMGSVTESVIRNSDIPVLAIKQRKEGKKVQAESAALEPIAAAQTG